MAERDNNGRFIKGHAPLKKVGDTAKLTRNIKLSLETVVSQEISKLPAYFAQIKSVEKKIDLLSKLLPYIVPRAEFDKREEMFSSLRSFTIVLTDETIVKPYQKHINHEEQN